MVPPAHKTTPLPSKAQLLEFIRDNPDQVGKREIARAFGIRGADRIWLKKMLKELASEGQIETRRKRRVTTPGRLPPVMVVEIHEIDVDGELLARPLRPGDEGPPPRIYIAGQVRGIGALTLGDRVLAKLEKVDRDTYHARPIRRIQAAASRVLGIYSVVGTDGRIQPTDRRVKYDLVVERADSQGAVSGEVVLAEVLPGRDLGLRRARVLERLGGLNDPRSLSLVAVHQHGIPTEFPDAAIAQAEAAQPVRLGKRVDLRDIPLITIDPVDARDRDDAVWAEPDPDPANPGGWHVIVAIADVAHYVRPGGALDKEARKRGNSVYFPDRVVPMLPEQLSSNLCSLQTAKNRACMAVHMWFDKSGTKRRHQFVRGLMRSAAGLTYRQTQAAIDGRPDEVTEPLLEPVLKPLYGAYRALEKARTRREPLAIEVPERRVVIGDDGFIASVEARERLDAHRLIEEFMVAANVCAAETLEALHRPCMYRIHEEPPRDKVLALGDFLDSLDLKLAKGQVVRPKIFNRLLDRVRGTAHEQVVNEVVLRTQSQAYYGPDNLGHFGLALSRYAHFTSPIRRYADLLVHRALIRGMKLGTGALSDDEVAEFAAIGEEISGTERRAMAAERDALDRFTTVFMSGQVGATFPAEVSGVTRFGLFVRLIETGAEGLIPMRALPDDYYDHDDALHALVGRRFGKVYRLGDSLEVRLAEADTVTGGLRFDIISGGGDRNDLKRPASRRGRPQRRGRPSGRRRGR